MGRERGGEGSERREGDVGGRGGKERGGFSRGKEGRERREGEGVGRGRARRELKGGDGEERWRRGTRSKDGSAIQN